jgi:drug/metabolite transporter (DMT)-like permease
VVFFYACPMLVLCPLIFINRKQLGAVPRPTIFAAVMIGLAFSLYANGLVETTVVRATLLYYLALFWSTLIGVLWLSER